MAINFNRVYTSGSLKGGRMANLKVTIEATIETLFAAAADMVAYGEEEDIDALTREAVEENLRDAVRNGCLTDAASYRWHDNNSDTRTTYLLDRVAALFPEAVPEAGLDGHRPSL